jgi:hypothetical protein
VLQTAQFWYDAMNKKIARAYALIPVPSLRAESASTSSCVVTMAEA